MNKFFKDDTTEAQAAPNDILETLFPAYKTVPEDIKARSNKWIVIKNGKTSEGCSYQVAIQDVPSLTNIFYQVLVFRLDDVMIGFVPVRAALLLPPVSQKSRGTDFLDWILIQVAINQLLESKGYKPIEVDKSPEGKMVYMPGESPKDVMAKVEAGEPYSIMAIPAEKYLENLKPVLKDVAGDGQEEKKIIVKS